MLAGLEASVLAAAAFADCVWLTVCEWIVLSLAGWHWKVRSGGARQGHRANALCYHTGFLHSRHTSAARSGLPGLTNKSNQTYVLHVWWLCWQLRCCLLLLSKQQQIHLVNLQARTLQPQKSRPHQLSCLFSLGVSVVARFVCLAGASLQGLGKLAHPVAGKLVRLLTRGVLLCCKRKIQRKQPVTRSCDWERGTSFSSKAVARTWELSKARTAKRKRPQDSDSPSSRR